MYEKLPQELKERGAFCLWKYEERDGSRTKVPYQTNGFRVDSANKATFTDYAIAVRHRAGYDGIGIGVFGDICAIDIDSCVENGVLADMAEDIIARMDTYTEYSPSGTGVRILFKASLPAYDKDRYYINNRQIKLEVYVAGYTSRFVTVTGNAISGTGVDMPKGILHTTEGAETGVTVTGDIRFDDVISLYFSVESQYRSNGVWLMNDETALKLKGLKDQNGQFLWNQNSDTILGKPVHISEFMPSDGKPIAFGDFSYYAIIDRLPLTVRTLHEKFALQQKIGYLGIEHLDGLLLRPEAVKVMKVTS